MSSSEEELKTTGLASHKGRKRARNATGSLQRVQYEKPGSIYPNIKFPRPSSSKLESGGASKKVCNICKKEEIPGLDRNHAQLLEYRALRAHYFCLLFSSGLGQSGHEAEGLQGFMPYDVQREIKRGSRLKCVYCKEKGATVGCARQQCKKSYHLPCGIENSSLQQFFDQVTLSTT